MSTILQFKKKEEEERSGRLGFRALQMERGHQPCPFRILWLQIPYSVRFSKSFPQPRCHVAGMFKEVELSIKWYLNQLPPNHLGKACLHDENPSPTVRIIFRTKVFHRKPQKVCTLILPLSFWKPSSLNYLIYIKTFYWLRTPKTAERIVWKWTHSHSRFQPCLDFHAAKDTEMYILDFF